MLRQLKYFQSVVKNNSFSLAAEECNISQSAISQQIRNLEQDLGYSLLERKNRKFTLTPAGEYFYQKSLVLVSNYERMCNEAQKIAKSEDFKLKIGYLRCYSGQEFQKTVEEFTQKHPDIEVEIYHGNHEELYKRLREETVDIVLNDQRRAFSDVYVNLELITCELYIALSGANPLSNSKNIEIEDLEHIPCILIATEQQQKAEEEYYRDVIGVSGGIIFSESIEEARLLAISGKGYMLLEGESIMESSATSLKRIALCKNGRPITKKYCAFWKTDNSGYYVEEFAELLEKHFDKMR